MLHLIIIYFQRYQSAKQENLTVDMKMSCDISLVLRSAEVTPRSRSSDLTSVSLMYHVTLNLTSELSEVTAQVKVKALLALEVLKLKVTEEGCGTGSARTFFRGQCVNIITASQYSLTIYLSIATIT